jgi:predicted RNA-binding protein with PUA-like domain
MAYWLIKSEPDVYGIEDMKREGIGIWDGVRNYQARNYLKQMQVGDYSFFYHSNAKPPGIAGLIKIAETNVPDPTQFDPSSDYYDPKSTADNPRWITVKCQYVETLKAMIPLAILREAFTPQELLVVQKATRLSVIPVDEAIARRILTLGDFSHQP